MEKTLPPPPPPPPPHFLLVTFPAQGHINPTLSLAKRLASTSPGTRVTFSTALSAHRRMFPSTSSFSGNRNNPLLSYIPYSNGFDDGYDPKIHDPSHYMSQITIAGAESLAAIIDELAASGRPVTCIIYSFFMSWAATVARDRGIPCFLFWIQPATAFAIYWHYFHDHAGVIAGAAGDPSSLVTLPGLASMRNRDIPSFITANSEKTDQNAIILPHIKDMFDTLETEDYTDHRKRRPRLLANTAAELEEAAVESISDRVEIIGVGPVLEDAAEGSLFKTADDDSYMAWLDSQEERSVVYVSFGSLSVLKKEQVEEINNGLRETGRPYLWVLRADSRWKGMKFGVAGEKQGMVVEWCEQRRVLEHNAVGCFVTHCGWNSTVEALLCGVPAVAVPQWTDQGTNAWLMERVWGTAARVEVEVGEVVAAEELRRCVEIAMGEVMRRKAAEWMEKGRKAVGEGGSSDRNLKAFVQEIIIAGS